MSQQIYHRTESIDVSIAGRLNDYFNACLGQVGCREDYLYQAYQAKRRYNSLLRPLNLVVPRISPAEFQKRSEELHGLGLSFQNLGSMSLLVHRDHVDFYHAAYRFLENKRKLSGFVKQVFEGAFDGGFKVIHPDPEGGDPVIVSSNDVMPREKVEAIFDGLHQQESGEDVLRNVTYAKNLDGGGLLDLTQSFGRAVKVQATSERGQAIMAERCLRRWENVVSHMLQNHPSERGEAVLHIDGLVQLGRKAHRRVDFSNHELIEGVDYKR